MPDGNRVAAAEVDEPQIVVGHFLRPDDMRRDGKDNFVLPTILILLPEEIFQYRDLRQPGITAERVRLGVFQNPTDQVDFSVPQTGFVLDATLADDRLADTANILRSTDRGDFQGHLQRDFALGMNTRSDIDVDTHVEILELSIDQCAYPTQTAGVWKDSPAAWLIKSTPTAAEDFASPIFSVAFSLSRARISGF